MMRTKTAVGIFAVMALAACSESTGQSDFLAPEAPTGGADNGSATNGSAAPTAPTSASSSSGAVASNAGASTSTPPGGMADVLTAGVWDDNLNFDFFTKYVSLSGDLTALAVPAFTDAQRQAAQTQWSGPRAAKTELDLAFMLDTTGSMGDELAYIQGSIDGISAAITASHPNLTPRFGLVVYRDFVDPYQVRSFDFSDLASFKTNLAAQSADGGGDYPEDVQDGLNGTLALGWRSDTQVARMTVWVADAPPHPGQEGAVQQGIVTAAQKDIHFYPVAASGADQRTEFTMRAAAQMTGGRYVFLTDDSGVGDSHEEPHIPCYVVTKFDGAIERMVESELTGQHVDAPASDVIRTVGDPQNGVCVTQSSGNVSLY